MIDKIKSIFIIPELRSRIIFTLSVLIVVRIGAHIPIPGVDGEVLALAFDNLKVDCLVYSIHLLVEHSHKLRYSP